MWSYRCDQGFSQCAGHGATTAPPLALNDSINQNPQGEYEDWIELHNAGGAPVDIGGMYMADDLLFPIQFRISTNDPLAPTISPGGSFCYGLTTISKTATCTWDFD